MKNKNLNKKMFVVVSIVILISIVLLVLSNYANFSIENVLPKNLQEPFEKLSEAIDEKLSLRDVPTTIPISSSPSPSEKKVGGIPSAGGGGGGGGGGGKIETPLQQAIQQKPEESSDVLFGIPDDKNLDEVSQKIVQSGGVVKGKYPVGNIIFAEIPNSKIEQIVKESSADAWTNKKVHALLDASVPQVGADVVWSAGYTGKNVKIAILDTGVDSSHPMLKGKVIAEKIFTGENHANDVHGHGTHVAGTVAGTTKNGGLYNGVAPDALIMNAKVLDDNGDGLWNDIIAAINWAVDPDGNPATDDGAKIISMSLGGYPCSDPWGSDISKPIKAAIERGVLVVVAAGNKGSGTIATPGCSPYALTVGAVDKYNNVATFSSRLDVPTVGIKPDIMAPGVGIKSSYVKNDYRTLEGTSMATPHVSGAAALLLEANPDLTPEQLRRLMEINSNDLGETGKDILYGYGILDLKSIVSPRIAMSQKSFILETALNKPLKKTINITNYGVKNLLIYNVTHENWIKVELTNRTIIPIKTENLNVEISPTVSGPGNFSGEIRITSNDENVSIPINLTVYETVEPVIWEIKIPDFVFNGDELSISVNATDEKSVESVEANIYDPQKNLVNTTFLELRDNKTWTKPYNLISGSPLGVYTLNITAKDGDGHSTTATSHFEVVDVIVQLPAEFEVNKKYNLMATYKNTETVTREITSLFTIKDLLGTEFIVNNTVNDIPSSQTQNFSFEWETKSPKDYSITVEILNNNTLVGFFTKNITVFVPEDVTIKKFSYVSCSNSSCITNDGIMSTADNVKTSGDIYLADTSENFDYPNSSVPDDWTVIQGINGRDAKIENGKMIVGDVENGMVVYNKEFSDFDLEVDVRNTLGDFSTGIVLRYKDNSNFYQFYYNPISTNIPNMFRLRKYFQGTGSDVAITSGDPGTLLHRIRIVANGSLFVIYVDGSEKIRVTDNSLSSGKIGFVASRNTKTEYDNLTVKDLIKYGRMDHFATLLNDGRVLVVGGYDDTNYLSSAILYNPNSDKWSATGSTINVGIRTTTLLDSRKVIALAGANSSGCFGDAELYDPATGRWDKAGNLPIVASPRQVVKLDSGKIIVAGGSQSGSRGCYPYLASSYIYDPPSNSWTQTGSLSTSRINGAAVLLKDGKVLIAGGSSGAGSYSSAELYDPVAGSWTSTGSMKVSRMHFEAVTLNDGKVLVVGGSQWGGVAHKSAELYDPSTGTWSFTGEMNATRASGFQLVKLSDGNILAIGGNSDAGGSPAYIDLVEVYNVSTGLWVPVGKMQFSRGYHTATLLNQSRVLVVGGRDQSGILSNYEFFNTTQFFNATPSFDFSVSNSGGVSVEAGLSINNTLYVSLLSGATLPVTLSVSDLPQGTTASFTPASSNPNFASVLTMTTSSNTPTGNYTITVTGSGGGIQKTTKFNLAVTTPSYTVLAKGQNQPLELAADSANVYWTEYYPYAGSRGVKKISLSGGQITTLVTDQNHALGIDLDNDYVYWGEWMGGNVKKIPKLIDIGAVTLLATGVERVGKIDVDAGYVYFVAGTGSGLNESLRRVSVNGGTIETLDSADYISSAPIRVKDEYVYFTGGGSIRRVPTGGGAVEPLSASNGANSLDVDDSFVYWGEAKGYIKKVSRNGGTVVNLISGTGNFGGLVASNNTVYWADLDRSSIHRVCTDGSLSATIATGLLLKPRAIIAVGNNVIWSEAEGPNSGTSSRIVKLVDRSPCPDQTPPKPDDKNISAIRKGSVVNYSVSAFNSGNNPINISAEINIVKDGKTFDVINSEEKEITSNSELTINLSKRFLFASGNYTFLAKLRYGNRVVTEFSKTSFYTPPIGRINGIVVPEKTDVSSNVTLKILFENFGDVPVETEIEGRVLKNGTLVDVISFGAIQVNESSTAIFERTYSFSDTGNYTLEVLGAYEGNDVNKTINFTVTDSKKPGILDINFDDKIKQKDPLLVTVDVTDDSGIKNVSMLVGGRLVKMNLLSRAEKNYTFSGIFYNTDDAKTYGFLINACDDFDNCIDSNYNSFTVESCSRPKIIIVSENYYLDEVLNQTYCVSHWQKSKILEPPPVDYLSKFNSVIWSEGDSFNSINDKEASLLMNYTKQNGRLLLEGSEIASSHVDDDFIKNVTHSKLFEDRVSVQSFFDPGKTVFDSINITRKHPITFSLPTVIEYNKTKSKYPDSVVPIDSVELASWNNGSSIIMYGENVTGNSRIVFLPFNLDALNNSVEAKLVRNIVDWILADSTTDLQIKNVTSPPYAIELEPTVFTLNIGTPHTTILKTYVDEKEEKSQLVSEGNVNITLSLAKGVHEIAFEINPSFETKESNYLNNLVKKPVNVVPKEPDVTVSDIKVSPSNPIADESVVITVDVKNTGGIPVTSDLKLFIENTVVKDDVVSLSPGEMKSVKMVWMAKSGLTSLVSKVDTSNNVSEINEADNQLTKTIYTCEKKVEGKPILLVIDDNTVSFTTEKPDSSETWVKSLQNERYCVDTWKQSEKNKIENFNDYKVVIWSSGDYWNTVLDANDRLLLTNFTGSLVFEGADIAFDSNETFVKSTLHSTFNKDIIANENTTIKINQSYGVLTELQSLTFNSSLSPYPDSVYPYESISVVEWDDGSSAIVFFNGTKSKMFYIAFSIDAVTESDKLISEIVKTVTKTPSTENLEISSLSELYVNSKQRIFGLKVRNYDNKKTNFTWSLDTGELVINSIPSIEIGPDEEVPIFIANTYKTTGNYTVVANIKGLATEKSSNIKIEIKEKLSLSTIKTVKLESFDVIQSNIKEKIFRLKIKNVDNKGAVNWEVDVGDGSITTNNVNLDENETAFVYVAYEYGKSGTYNVRATVKGDGTTDSKNSTVTIIPKPKLISNISDGAWTDYYKAFDDDFNSFARTAPNPISISRELYEVGDGNKFRIKVGGAEADGVPNCGLKILFNNNVVFDRLIDNTIRETTLEFDVVKYVVDGKLDIDVQFTNNRVGYIADCRYWERELGGELPTNDMSISNLKILKTSSQGRIFTFVIKNTGQNKQDNVNWRLEVLGEQAIENKIPLTLEVNDSILVAVNYDYTSPGTRSVKVLVDPNNIIQESNENDNMIETTG